jgi:hypothetical protein
MSIDMSIHQLSRIRYDEMLREAEEERLAARVRRKNGAAPVVDQLLLNLSNWLLETGARLKQRTEMRLDLG